MIRPAPRMSVKVATRKLNPGIMPAQVINRMPMRASTSIGSVQ